VTKMYGELDKPRNLGHFLLALDISKFSEAAVFRAQIDLLLREIHGENALAPGEPERLIAVRRSKEGVPLGEGTLGELNALAGQLGVAPL